MDTCYPEDKDFSWERLYSGSSERIMGSVVHIPVSNTVKSAVPNS